MICGCRLVQFFVPVSTIMYIGIATNIFNDFLLSLVGIATGADANKLENVY